MSESFRVAADADPRSWSAEPTLQEKPFMKSGTAIAATEFESSVSIYPLSWPRIIAAPAPEAAPPWEYYVAHFSGTSWEQIQASLNAAGHEGWELVNADVQRNQRVMGAPTTVNCFMKRQRAAQ